MAEEINNFFIDIGQNLAESIPESLLEIDYNFNGNYPKFRLETIDREEVRKLPNNVSANKSTGIDRAPIRFLKLQSDKVLDILTYIINLSISKQVPQGWKTSIITPLYKNGKKSPPGNNRLVAILPAASKLQENVIHKQLYDYFSHNKLLL